MEVSFIVEGTPVAKPRMTQKDKWFPRPCVYEYYAWADLIRMSARPVLEMMQGPILLACHFRLAIPPSWSKKKKALVSNRQLAHTQKPDLKNLLASVEDALNGVLWGDDSQIAAFGPCSKIWAATPGVTVHATTVEPELVWSLSQTAEKRASPARVRRIK